MEQTQVVFSFILLLYAVEYYQYNYSNKYVTEPHKLLKIIRFLYCCTIINFEQTKTRTK